MSFIDERTDYGQRTLGEDDVGDEPMAEVARWIEHAEASGVPEPHALSLATVDEQGFPSARIVLARRVDARGVVFFTNYESRKGHELAATGRAAMVFFWPDLERQVRVEGTVTRLPGDESDAYYLGRPLGSRLGAWASPQSKPIQGRAELEDLYTKAEHTLGEAPPRPPFWGGYLLAPTRVELWQGRKSRLHDRLVWRREAGATGTAWIRERLAP